MNMKFGIKNFRIFDEEGVIFNIAPITILTGCNSAGKSSMVKSLILLDNFFRQMKQDLQIKDNCYPEKYRLGVTNHSLRLGNFASVLNRDSQSNIVSFSYRIKPLIASEPFIVTYSFKADDADSLNDGWLHSVEIANANKQLVCRLITDNGQARISECNWSLLKDTFAQFGAFSLERELNEQIDVNNNLPEVFKYTEEGVQRFKTTLEKIKELGWTKRISTENILDFNDAYVNHTETKKLFEKNDIFMIQRFLENNQLLHYLPVFELVKSKSKNEVRSILQNAEGAGWNADMDAIVSKYEVSKFDTFEDFVRDLEENCQLCSVGADFVGTWEPGLRNVLKRSLTYRYKFTYDELDISSWETVADYSEDEWKTIKVSLTENEIEAKKQQRREKMPFDFLIATLWKYSMAIDSSFKSQYKEEYLNGCEHQIVHVFAKYVQQLLMNLLIPSTVFDKFVYVGSTKAEAQRLYRVDTSYMEPFERTINNYMECKRNHQGDYVPDTFLNKWIREFGIGHAITIKNTTDGLGIAVYLHTSESDVEGHLLADEGYGITQLLSVLLNIETAILDAKKQAKIPLDRKLHGCLLSNDKLVAINAPAYIAIEEPEIHLHPRYQSLLMDMFYDAYKNYNIRFIIETHSEYLVRRSQVIVAEMGIQNELELEERNPFRVYYIPEQHEGKPYDMEYKTSGRFSKQFGTGFFDEASSLALSLF